MVDARNTIRERMRVFPDWHFFQEAPISPSEVLKGLADAALPSLSFLILLILSTVIATNGLIANSAATVIRADVIETRSVPPAQTAQLGEQNFVGS